MKSLSLAVFFVAVCAASAGLHAGVVAGLGSPAVIAGPSGTVVRSGVAHGGVIGGHGWHGAGAVIVPSIAAGVVAPGLWGHGLLAGHGHEGQYVHDYTETLYDDGSYKPHVYGH